MKPGMSVGTVMPASVSKPNCSIDIINYPAASYGVSNGKTLPGREASFGESHPARD
jgi:hypothetical protein